jgi:hypothetical protein
MPFFHRAPDGGPDPSNSYIALLSGRVWWVSVEGKEYFAFCIRLGMSSVFEKYIVSLVT